MKILNMLLLIILYVAIGICVFCFMEIRSLRRGQTNSDDGLDAIFIFLLWPLVVAAIAITDTIQGLKNLGWYLKWKVRFEYSRHNQEKKSDKILQEKEGV